MQDKDIGVEKDFPPRLFDSQTPIDIAKKHPETFVQKSDFIDNRPGEDHTSTLWLIDFLTGFMIEFRHFPTIAFHSFRNPIRRPGFE